MGKQEQIALGEGGSRKTKNEKLKTIFDDTGLMTYEGSGDLFVLQAMMENVVCACDSIIILFIFFIAGMSYTMSDGVASNCSIVINADEAMVTKSKQVVLKQFQKEVKMPGFRTGHVPLSVVEGQIKPEYLSMSVYEQIITDSLQKIIEKEKEKRFIGVPYNINFDEKEGGVSISLSLDVYPDVVVINNDRESSTLSVIATDVGDEDVDRAVFGFKKQYADYVDTENVGEMTVTKVSYHYLDKKGEKFGTSVLYVGDEEVAEHPLLKEIFWGKKKGEIFTLDYNEKKLPVVLHVKKDQGDAQQISFSVGDVKSVVLPTFETDNIKKFFGDDAKIKNEEEVIKMITESMKEEKFTSSLTQGIESLLQGLMKDSFSVVIPQTMIEQESKQRIKNMEERFGGKDHFDKYVQKIGDEQHQAMIVDVKRASKESLEKFLVFKKYIELLALEVNWDKPMDAECQLYEKLTGEKQYTSSFLDKIHKRK